MSRAGVESTEIDLSTRVAESNGVYAGIVVKSFRGRVGIPTLVTNQTQFLQKFTPEETIKTSYEKAHFSAMTYLESGNKLWVTRVAKGAKYGGIVLVKPVVIQVGEWERIQLPNGEKVIEAFNVQFPAEPEAGQTVTDEEVGYVFTFTPDAQTTNKWIMTTPPNADAELEKIASELPTEGLIDGQIEQVSTESQWKYTVTSTETMKSKPLENPIENPETYEFQANELCLLYPYDQGAWSKDLMLSCTPYSYDNPKTKQEGTILLEVFTKDSPNKAVESFVVSRDKDLKDAAGSTTYIEEVLKQSKYFRAFDNTNNPTIANTDLPDQFPNRGTEDNPDYKLNFSAGDDGGVVTTGDRMLALDEFYKTADYPLTMILDGGSALNSDANYHKEIQKICEKRQDCVGILTVPEETCKNSDPVEAIRQFRMYTQAIDSSYCALYAPTVEYYDKYNDRTISLAPDGLVGGRVCATYNNYELWYPVAGYKRGKLNVSDVTVRFTDGEQDILYDNGINPLIFEPSRGVTIWGQKTQQVAASALDRLNVRMLLITIRPAIANALREFTFDLNDEITRKLCVSIVDSYMTGIKGRRGVYDFQIVCDDSNNSPEDIDNYICNFWLFVKPTKALEFIKFKTIVTRTGVSFEEVSI